jgi:hypothetical protein
VIAEPLNDSECLGKLTRVALGAVERDDVRQLGARFRSTAGLAAWIRSLPQRHDAGHPSDGPRVTCDVSQRARVLPDDPNCVERSLLYLAAAEALDPVAVRQLATIETVSGRHTFPIEEGRPVLLDPAVPRNALRAGLFLMTAPATIPDEPPDPRELLPWLADVAADQADDERGRLRVRRARDAFARLLARQPLNAADHAAITYTLDRAEEAAPMFGNVGVFGVQLARAALKRSGVPCNCPHPNSQTSGSPSVSRPRSSSSSAAATRNVRIGGYSLRPDWKRISSAARSVNWERAAYWGGLGAATVYGGPLGAATYQAAYGQIIGQPSPPAPAPPPPAAPLPFGPAPTPATSTGAPLRQSRRDTDQAALFSFAAFTPPKG